MATSVYIRMDDRANGKQTIYLQFKPPIRNKATMKRVYKEMLGIYLYKKPKDDVESQHNKEMMYIAKGIQAKRVQALMNEEHGFLNKERMKEDFLEYFASIAEKKTSMKWISTFKHFYNFVNGSCIFGEIDVDLCRRFREYLLEDALQLNEKGRPLSHNSAAGYYSTFRALLKVAHRDRRLIENINEYLDKIKWEDSKKEFLTIDEVKMLIRTPSIFPVLKSAALFSCLTGLRISDILRLEWKHIVKQADGENYCMRIRTEKTGTVTTLPLSNEALEWCGERGNGVVFKGLLRHMIYKPLKEWLTESGIKKHITFHCFRHTFAVQLLSHGADIYTVSKMLTHKHVSTTEIYADIVNEKKIESANLVTFK